MFSPTLSFDYFLPTSTPYGIGADRTPLINLDVKIYPYWFKDMTLSWSIPASWSNKSPRFNIYRSGNEVVGFTKLTAAPITSLHYQDLTTRESSMSSNEYYIVEAILSDGSTWKTRPISVGDTIPEWQDIR
ncbi:MAG TPA: hypothetical protein VFM18_21265, partial [Methanosarcina sp.]|nr:hypothetical protein [Methanosarcina sp.]